MSLQLYYVYTLPGKTNNKAKRSTACFSAFCWTHCSKRSQKVVQCSVRFFPCLLENYLAVSPDPLICWGGTFLFISNPLWRSSLGAFGVLISREHFPRYLEPCLNESVTKFLCLRTLAGHSKSFAYLTVQNVWQRREQCIKYVVTACIHGWRFFTEHLQVTSPIRL